MKSNLGSISRAGDDAPLGRVNPQHLTLKRAAARGCSVPKHKVAALQPLREQIARTFRER